METERLIEIIQNEIKKDKEQSLKDIVNILLYCFQMPDSLIGVVCLPLYSFRIFPRSRCKGGCHPCYAHHAL